MEIIGRKRERASLTEHCSQNSAQFIALYGRRRVGKTFLIRNFFESRAATIVNVTGQQNGKRERQLAIFQTNIEKALFESERLPTFRTWEEGFSHLTAGLKLRHKDPLVTEILVFLDELPWLSTRKSGLIEALEHAWNTELQYLTKLRLVVCGSAASWMIRNVINARGGLHNRLTATMRLLPLSLAETDEFLRSKKIDLTQGQVLELYMALGGVPFYLEKVRKGLSAAQNIGHICFGDGELRGEFQRLFSSLFDNSASHIRIVQALAEKRRGLTREEIVKQTSLPSGGALTGWLEELEEAGFIARITPVDRKTKDTLFRLIDEFCIFHLDWIEESPSNSLMGDGMSYWVTRVQSQKYSIWCGYAFESVCFKHIEYIKAKLGLLNILCEVGSWSLRAPKNKTNAPAKKEQRGTQIDLLFDRADRAVTLCEMKYSQSPYVITKSYIDILEKKEAVYLQNTKSKKHVLIALVTPFGVEDNEHSRALVTNIITLANLFSKP
jgi:predicted AAA+ superfamily ATPase